MESLEMASLDDIQELVDQAQQKIVHKDFHTVQTDLWPQIKDAVARYSNLPPTGRMKMQLAIYKGLDESGQEGAEPERIVLEKLISTLPTIQEPPEDLPIIWLAW